MKKVIAQYSGVFRISVRRGQCTVGVEGSGVWWKGLGTSPEKKSFLSKNDKIGCILPQFLTGTKHGSPGTRILQFNSEITRLQKIIQQFTVRPKRGAVAPSPPPFLNTPIAPQFVVLYTPVAERSIDDA